MCAKKINEIVISNESSVLNSLQLSEIQGGDESGTFDATMVESDARNCKLCGERVASSGFEAHNQLHFPPPQ